MEIVISKKSLGKKPVDYASSTMSLVNPLGGKRVLPIRNISADKNNFLIFQYYDKDVKYEFNLNEIERLKVTEFECERLKELTNGIETFSNFKEKILVYSDISYNGTPSAPLD